MDSDAWDSEGVGAEEGGEVGQQEQSEKRDGIFHKISPSVATQ